MTIRIRPLRRTDGDLLDAVMDGMSAQSRYQRYHGPKPRLTSADRRYLTNVDDSDHLGLVALAADGTPVAIVRAVRLKDEPLAAEIGVEVVDGWQGQGIGTTMIARIARRAAAAGIVRLHARVLDETGFGRSLMRRGWSRVGRDGPSVLLAVDAWAVARRGDAQPLPLAPPFTAAG
jgi:GNAT superfamily N-acetyltransferase